MDDRDRHLIHFKIAVDDAEFVLFATPKPSCMTQDLTGLPFNAVLQLGVNFGVSGVGPDLKSSRCIRSVSFA